MDALRNPQVRFTPTLSFEDSIYKLGRKPQAIVEDN